MEQVKERRSIAEVIMAGEGEYNDLLKVVQLGDGTCLIYETQKLFAVGKMGRVARINISNGKEMYWIANSFPSSSSEEAVISKLNDYLMGKRE